LLTEQLNNRFMKSKSIFMLALVAIFIASAGMKPVPQDDPKQAQKKAHVKMVTVKDGKKEVLDTVIEGKDLKVMHMGKGNAFTWTMTKNGSAKDTLSQDIEIVKGDGKLSHVTVRKKGGERRNVIIREVKTEGDSGKTVTVTVENAGPDGERVFMTRPDRAIRHRVVGIRHAPGMPVAIRGNRIMRHLPGRNVIDLGDPGIISYQKKRLSGGREKITIIRNEVNEEENGLFNIKEGGPLEGLPMIDVPHVQKEIKVHEKNPEPAEIEKK
jgi:hypothetical protein